MLRSVWPQPRAASRIVKENASRPMYYSASLNFADSAGHIFVAAFIFGLGAFVALIQYRIFRVPQRLAVGLYVWHTILCLFFFFYSKSMATDASGYFTASQNFSWTFEPGTQAIVAFTALFTRGLNLSYGGVFLVFNIIGFIGMLALASVIVGLTRSASRTVRTLALFCLFLPGLSFWSAAIGKDALTFLGVCLACWASMDLMRRFPSMVLAIIFIALPRPHIAAVMLIALGMAVLFSGRVPMRNRVFFVLTIVPVAYYGLTFALGYLGVENVAALQSYAYGIQGNNTQGSLSIDIVNMSIPARMLSYLYRPSFFDGAGSLGLLISLEGSVLFLLMMAGMYLWLKRRKSTLPPLTWWWMIIYAFVSWFILANTTANLGIAMRQKWMFLPMILIICFSYIGTPVVRQERSLN